MKFSTFLFPAFIATALASPVQQRDTSSLSSIISTLQTSVLAHDASLNKTSASLSPSSSKEDKAAAVAATDADIKAITASLQTAQSSVKSLKAEQKRDTSAEQTQQMNAIYQDILYTMTNVPKDTLASTSPGTVTDMASSMMGFAAILGGLLTGVVNVLGNVVQLLVAALVSTIPGLLNIGGFIGGLPGQTR